MFSVAVANPVAGEVVFALMALAVDVVAAVRVVRLDNSRLGHGRWSKAGWLAVVYAVSWHVGLFALPVGGVLAICRTRPRPEPPGPPGQIPFAEGHGWPEEQS